MLIFVQVPGFYAAVEEVDRPAAGGRPIIVGGDPGKGGAVTSASARAREAGVIEGMDMREARRLCPDAELRSTRLRRYREVAAELRSLLRAASDGVEPVDLAGAYLQPPAPADPVEVAAEVCVRLRAELGLRAVAGIGPTRFVAHLAGRHAGPAGIRAVSPDAARAFLAPFPVTEIWGLGPATAARLADLGIATIGDLQGAPPEALDSVVPRNGAAFRALAHAEPDPPLRPSPRVKSLSRETTLADPSGDVRTLGDSLTELAARLEEMLTRERRAARTVTLGLAYVDGERTTRTLTLPEPVTAAPAIAGVSLDLLARTQAGVRLVRRLRLQVTNLCRAPSEAEPRQLRLF